MEGYQPTNSIAFSAGSKEQFGNHLLTPLFFVHQVEKAQKTETSELLLLNFEQQMYSSATSPAMCSSVLLLQIETKMQYGFKEILNLLSGKKNPTFN